VSDDHDDDGHEVGGTDDGAGTVGANISPSWTWGSSATIDIPTTNAGTTVSASAQVAQVSLPEPAVCSFYIQAAWRGTSPLDVVRVFTINLSEGIGRVTVPRQVSFQFQPAINAPLEFTLPFVPVHALQVNIEASVDIVSEDPAGHVFIDVYFVLSPITRIPQQQQKLAFGMAMPGEADDLDDELREDLESEGPTAQAAVMQGRRSVDGSNDQIEGEDDEGEDDEGEDDDERPQPPPWLLNVVEQLTRRHGRKPTIDELRAAVQRLKARRARQRRRGR
jgi:hypothetical protein